MLDKTGRYSYWIEPARCDFYGNATIFYLFGILLEVAARHADDRGFGYVDMTKKHRAWVLSRIGLYVHRYPCHDEKVQCLTWVESVERKFTRRCFAILSENNEILLRAQSYWAAIDVVSRRPCNIIEMDPSITKLLVENNPYPMPTLNKLLKVDCENPILFSPHYSDFDINKHFNSVKYVEHIINMYGDDLFQGKTVNSFEIVYLKEVLPNDKILLLKNNTDVEMINKESGESICKATVNIV